MESDELEDRDIVGARKTLAMIAQSNFVNFGIVLIIILYWILTFIFMSIPPENDNNVALKATYHSIEAIFIFVFVVEVAIFRYSFKEMYFSNKFNFINFIFLIIIIIFLVSDIAIDNFTVSVLLRSRGVMRLFHVPVILESIKSRIKRQKMNDFDDIRVQCHDKPTVEQVIEILMSIQDSIEDSKIWSDISFTIKQIVSGKLYDVKTKDAEIDEVKSVRKRRGAILQMEENAWIKSWTNVVKLKRDSNDYGTIIMAVSDHKTLESIIDLPISYISTVMEKIETLEFDIFEFKEKCKDRELSWIASLLLHKHSLYSGLHISINKFMGFINKISSGYNNVKYHNKTHAADVAQTLYYFVINGDWITLGKMDNIDIWSMVLGASCHDYEHPGYNNYFLINTKDTLALRYNDISVLESHHVASSFALLKIEQYNIFNKLCKDDESGIRKRMIHMILSTDMSKHFADIGTFKQRVSSDNFQPDEKDKLLCMGIGMHLSDISNPTKHWDLTLRWTELLFEEFFKQGDKERELGLKITDLMDRATTNIAKAQLGFIDVIVMPSYEAFSKFIKIASKNIKNMTKNREIWASKVDEYQKKMQEGLKQVLEDREIIQEAKSESEEDASSNKVSSMEDSSCNENSFSDVQD